MLMEFRDGFDGVVEYGVEVSSEVFDDPQRAEGFDLVAQVPEVESSVVLVPSEGVPGHLGRVVGPYEFHDFGIQFREYFVPFRDYACVVPYDG